jgi:hypothetical protein
MLRRFIQHGEVRLNGVLDTILLQEPLRAIQMFVDVSGHSFEFAFAGLPLLNSCRPRAMRGARGQFPLYTAKMGRAKPLANVLW